MTSFPRLSGGKGVHLVVPIAKRYSWDQSRDFCDRFAHAMEERAPQRYVATMSKAKREGRVFIDWLRNGRGATAVSSFSLRARPGAPVAMPVTWDEFAKRARAGSLQAEGCGEARGCADLGSVEREGPEAAEALIQATGSTQTNALHRAGVRAFDRRACRHAHR